MRYTHALSVLVLVVALMGCNAQVRGEAPFYMYNSSLLNGGTGLIASGLGQPAPAGPPLEESDRAVAQRAQDHTTPSQTVEPVTESRPAPAGFNRPSKNTMQVTQKAAPPSKKQPVANEPALSFNPADAAAYVMAVYKINGIDLGVEPGDNAIAEIYTTVKEQGSIYHATRPAVGDLVFFHNTFDRNTDVRNNDWYTHIGIIEMVEKDGTISVLSYVDDKIQSFVINLEHPKLARDDRSKKIWNTRLRGRRGDDPPFTQYPGGELFAGFGNILGDRTEFVVIDNWSPGMKSQ